jgi:predicted metalloprotease with PDZ domain
LYDAPVRTTTIVPLLRLGLLVGLLLGLTAVTGTARAAERRVTLTVDAREAPRRILHVREVIAATPGALTLRYPKWIPGEHGPNGPVVDVAGLHLRAGGKSLEWRRDDVDLYALHVTVPAGADSIEAQFDYLAPADRDAYSGAGSTTEMLLGLEWNLVVLYPDNVNQHDLIIAPRLTVPHGWKIGTALESAPPKGDSIEFKPVNLETLVDSPVVAGAFFRSLPLGVVDSVPHVLDVVADSEAALDIDPAALDGFKRLVVEAGLLFGSRHFSRYHFLLVLSNKAHFGGLEHHQSSNNRERERFLIDGMALRLSASLLPHEMVHSWNGKFRRPAGLAVDGFDKPMRGELLWVYEGLTNYLGWVLAARSGLRTPEWAREDLAATAALMATRAGRQWRPLEDTAVGASLFKRGASEWGSWRRGTDYYPEGTLLWLEADATIRARTSGKKSLDDFCRLFYGGPNQGPEVKPYQLDDVVAALQAVSPGDWKAFFHDHVQAVAPAPPLGGIARAGWKLVYDDKKNERLAAVDELDHTDTLLYALGFNMKTEGDERGYVVDVLPGSPAAKAGLAPGMRVIGVNGRKLSKESFKDALKLGRSSKTPLELLVVNSDYYLTLAVDYHGGARQPHLQADKGAPNLLEQITRPLQTSISPAK